MPSLSKQVRPGNRGSDATMIDSKTESVIVCAVVRDSAQSLQRIVQTVLESFATFREIHWVLVESDSQDHTLQELERLANSLPNFRYLSLGNVERRFPKRTQRLAHCRNVYRRIVAWSPRYLGVKYVAVLDADHVNFGLTREAVDSIFSRDDWDACFANQFGKYYDLYALRHEHWISTDIIQESKFYTKISGVRPEMAATRLYEHRMVNLAPNQAWIRVDSAFGGLGVYKKLLFRLASYKGKVSGRSVCEHVPFHTRLSLWRKRLFINPALLNGDAPEHWLETSSE